MAFDIALSGVNAAFSMLKTASNNIANASSTGFKQSRTELSELNNGSTGAGVKVSQVTAQPSQGNLRYTNNSLDMAINGKGYFAVNDNGSAAYSRAGAFHLDRNGYVVNTQNQRLQGFLADAAGNISNVRGDLQLNTSSGTPAATRRIDLGLNLNTDASAPSATFNVNDPSSYNYSMAMTAYDSLGKEHQMNFYFSKTATPNQWDVRAYADGSQVLNSTPIQFSPNGTLTSPPPADITIPSFNPGTGASNLNITVGMTKSTQYSGSNSVNSLTQDGYNSSRLDGFAVNDNGIVSVRYSNGQTRTIAQISLSDFNNPQGLQPLGNGGFGETYGSGQAITGAPGTGNFGLIQSGALENSNVDIAEQLLALKMAKYQSMANVKSLNTAEQMLGALFQDKA